jgi:hemoglobin
MTTDIFTRAGGEAAFLRLARAHHQRCLADPELAHPFSHGDLHPQHVERLAAYWGEVFGGPPAYSAAGGRQAAVLRMHAGNGDLTDLGQRFCACFRAAADDAGLPDDPALRQALDDYMRWAVSTVALSHPDGADGIDEQAPVPRWDWQGLVTGRG